MRIAVWTTSATGIVADCVWAAAGAMIRIRA
jgi:hypothetical protein